MNLVPRKYLAPGDDESGVLILSQFTGASRELREALIVNPYDIEEWLKRSRRPGDGTPRTKRPACEVSRETLRNRKHILLGRRSNRRTGSGPPEKIRLKELPSP